MKQPAYSVPLYMLQPRAVISFAAQTLEYASQALGYRDPSASSNSNVASERVKDEQSGLNVYTLDEVSQHDSYNDCWIILYDKVFDVTQFMMEHPGGEEVIMEHAGRDATIAFRGVGHSVPALQALDEYLVGILPANERVYTGDGPCQWSTL
ncbi:cytochrome b5-like [Palaemon carinicauda]|uniref:cytochrome b5-like n=1 Tax=Palaemon carinicauda TaxID=392227 RepID=UPI0035B601ED